MAEIALAVAQTLFAALQCSQLKEICSVWKYETQLEDLKKTVDTIKNVLKDAESKLLTTEEEQGYIKELKDIVYDADDLFDEFVTLLESNQLKGSQKKHAKFIQKVRNFFSSDNNQVRNAYTMFKEVKKIQNKLDGIVGDHKKFALGVDYKPIRMRREETCSYVDFENIVGRDNDKNSIINQLLEHQDQDVCFLTVVGVGGLGKTALAQLVFNDEKLKKEFENSMFWVCVSDQDKASFDVKAILCKILELVMPKESFANLGKELVYQQFKDNLGGKKYLLVLDDVWNEDRKKWIELQNFLMLGQGGSRVLVTTRSEATATVIGDGRTYKLQGLSREDSWHLFEMTAFKEGSNQHVVEYKEMEEIGHKIVRKCSNIPLAIKVVGSLLFGQRIDKWNSFEKMGLGQIGQIDSGENNIIDVLKLSYYNLPSSLKSCFTYCAVFPKDFVLHKRMLISLWMAQGFIEPLYKGQPIEDVAEEHFSILLRRCFFQDVKKDEFDDVRSVKIHDLMHDVAQEVGGGEIQVGSNVGNSTGNKTRHVSMFDVSCLQSSSNWTQLRSLIRLRSSRLGSSRTSLGDFQVVDNCKRLRVLDLGYVGVGSSLNSIGELHHLRYLDLSGHQFEELPNSITKLHNLQTLILFDCGELRQLPHDFSKLGKLRHLDISLCWKLTCMPSGLDKLTSLRLLTWFIARGKEIAGKESDDELKYLGTLTNLTGGIRIYVKDNYKNVEVMKDMSGGGYLSKMKHLKRVTINISIQSVVEAEAALEKLEPHPNLKRLVLDEYNGTTIPWDNWAISLRNLVSITIAGCRKLVYLPSFSKLAHLKSLYIGGLDELEYMEKKSITSSSASAEEATAATFFPSLETLDIFSCEKWKGGWFREEGLEDADCGLKLGTRFRFPCLSSLRIYTCLNVRSFPPCPSVKDITLAEVQKTPQLMKKMMMGSKREGENTVGNRTSSSSSSCLATLNIISDEELESLSEYESVFEICASSLRDLKIEDCGRLTTLSGGLEHLTALESLTIRRCDAVESLPEGIQNLTSLKYLSISDRSISRLTERCREPHGEDWPKIQHIPNIIFDRITPFPF